MDYSNKTLIQEYLNKLDNLFKIRREKNPLTSWIQSVLCITNTQTLIDHPELFESELEYQQFLQENELSEQEKIMQGFAIMPFFQQRVYSRIEGQITTQFNMQKYPDSFETQYYLQELKQALADKQSLQLERFINNTNNKLIDGIDKQYTVKQLSEISTKNVNKLNIILEQQERQRANSLSFSQEYTKPEDDRFKYKQWVWTPNPRTRHTRMADKIVPIDEQFHVISDQDTCPDAFMMFPLDPLGTDCQCFNCKCTLIYTNKRNGL